MKAIRPLILVVSVVYLIMFSGCYGGNSPGDSDPSGITGPYALKGVLVLPPFGSTTSKETSKVLAATSPTATVQILDLKGNLIATADVTPGSASDTFNYSTTANISKDAIVKGVRENQTLRAALDSSTFTSGASRKVDVITTTAVVVIEQEMGITVGSLGTTSAPASPLSLKTVTIATLEANISQAVSSASSSTTTNFTSTDAAYANLAAIVTAATVSNINAAQYIANPSSATISIPITTYSVSKTGTPISTTAIMTPSVMQSTLNDALNTIVQPKPTGSTGGTGVAN